MNATNPLAFIGKVLPGALLIALSFAAPATLHAQTFWTGPSTNFTQAAAYNPSNPATMDQLVTGVSISRNQNGPLFNPAAGEGGSDFVNSPADTEWAFGTIDQVGSLTFQSFASLRNGDLADVIKNQPMVLHLISEDIYISVMFSAWGQHFAGGFAYARSTAPAVVTAPTVSIVTPTNGTILASPANLHLSASTTGGPTNVQYFAGATSLGQATTSPFSVTGTPLTTGNYSITAVATAGGISATSTVVNVSVVTPVTVILTAPQVHTNKFVFNYSATPGLSYVIQASLDLKVWAPLATNVATSNPVSFTNNFNVNSSRFFRVGRLPNP